MWLKLVWAIFVGAMLLYVPGFVFMRGFRLSRPLAVVCAPLYTVCMYALLPVIYEYAGIACSVLSVVVPTLVVALCTYGTRRLRRYADCDTFSFAPVRPLVIKGKELSFDVVALGLFALIGTLVCVWVFTSSLATADAWFPRYDNQTHINLIRAFMDSGKWSSMHTSVFETSLPNERPIPYSTGGMYPAAWHCIVVLVCLATGASIPIGINAVITITCALMWPLAAYAFLRALFPHDRLVVLCGVVASTACATWPWYFNITGPLYPNELGLALVPAVLAITLLFVEGQKTRSTVALFVVICMVAAVALALSHPSTVFTLYVFMAFYGSHVVWQLCARTFSDKPLKSRRTWQLCAVAALWLVVLLVWLPLVHAPLFSQVTSFVQKNNTDLLGSLDSILLMKFNIHAHPQFGLILATVVGGIALFCKPSKRWLILPAAYFALASIVNLMDIEALREWMSGFWYNDRRRLAVNCCIYLVPVVAWGLSVMVRGARSKEGRFPWLNKVSAAGLVLVIVLTYVPTVWLPSNSGGGNLCQLQAMKEKTQFYYGDDEDRIYSPSEMAFVDRVKRTIPANALVANVVPDGSVWAYGLNSLNTLFRTHRFSGTTDDAELIREHLNEYATSSSVRDAVERLNVQYVLLLDKGVSYEDGHWVLQVSPSMLEKWRGVNSVDDTTPGFTLVLSEGDEMRLYKIDR